MKIKYIFILLVVLLNQSCSVGQHPSLTLTDDGINTIKESLGSVDLFDEKLDQTIQLVDSAIKDGIDVPVPKDMAGGYTHQRHKYNYKIMHHAGNLYQLTGKEKYAELVKEMLLEYATLYPTLPLHPTMKSYATGKIFWQCLNDANWLVFSSQAYDCIYDYLTKEERMKLETDLFVPFADFLSIENPKFFNRIHNHSTWANAAVGLAALAMDNDTLLHKALYGLENDGIDPNAFDDDGGYFKKDGVTQAGFLAQLDYSFSPDGYFSEGPYYQRYAIFPFLVFSHALHNKKPELDIFNYRDGIMKKATRSLLQLTNTQGQFFPINDSQKGMSFKSFEIVTAVDLMYLIDDSQEYLLDWAAIQNTVALNEAGYKVAKALKSYKPKKIIKQSKVYGDGVSGKEGGVAVLRQNKLELLFKFSTQGMGHGHFDRLSYSLLDDAGEIIQDYGAVRWVNVDQKAGGRYLPENKTFGKQTVGHNTIVIDNTSHFNGKVKNAEAHHPDLYFSDFSNKNFKAVSATENNAYPGTKLQRTLYLIEDEDLKGPVVFDIFKVACEKESDIELPLWFFGQTMKSNFDCPKQKENLSPMGKDFGYQHIWKESSCDIYDSTIQFNWFNNNRFYTMTAVSEKGDKVVKGRTGANDPNYNLRQDPVLIHQKANSKKATFINVIEAHGIYNRTTEIPIDPYGSIQNVTKIYEDENYIIASFETRKNKWVVMLSLNDNNKSKKHEVRSKGNAFDWTGATHLIKEKK